MGARGPKGEPAAVKIAKGNSGHRRIGKDPVTVEAISGVTPPPWLKGDGLSQWNRLAPLAEKMKLLTRVDVESFARYCRAFARWLKMQDALDNEGEFYEITTESGTVKRPHPAFIVSDRIERQLTSIEDRFGLNPSERQRIYAQRASSDQQGDLFNQSKAPGVKPESDTGDEPLIGMLN